MTDGTAPAPGANKARPQAVGRKSGRKKDAIVRAAIGVINARSYALVTMAEISANLDLQDSTLYYYFPSKQALAFECHLRSLHRFETVLGMAEGQDATGLEKLRFLINGLVEAMFATGPLMYFGDYSYLGAAERITVRDIAEKIRVRLLLLVESGIADGSMVVCEPAMVVQLMLGMIIWLVKWTQDIDGLTPERLMQSIDAFAFHGLESRSKNP